MRYTFNKMKQFKLLVLLILPLIAGAQRVSETNDLPVHVVSTLPLALDNIVDTIELGMFADGGVGPIGVEFGAGAYEKVRVGKNFLAIVDAKISGNGNETFVRVRAGLGYRQKSFYAIAILPQFVQRNYNEYNTPLGAEAGLDRKLLMLSLSADFYNDRPVFYFRARIQIRA